jgi:glycosyltransferase involved in cell wall biosynthesis
MSSLLPAVLKLRRLIRAQKYDIVETSMLSPSVIASWATIGGYAKHVAGLHDVFQRNRHTSRRYRFWRLSMKCNRRTRFYAISNYARQCWLEYSRTPAAHTVMIHNGIPDDCYNAISDRPALLDELGLDSDTRLILFVGRLLKRKGIDTLYEAVSHVLREHNLALLYVGAKDAPEEFFPDDPGTLERLKQLVKTDGLVDRVRFLGRRTDVPRLMASCDLLVHPARIEGFGLVLAEALAAGLPVVASNVEGIPEVLAGTDSIMVAPNDPDALCSATLRTLQRSPEEAAQALEKGRHRADDFRMKKRIDAMIQFFTGVVTERL